MHMDREQETYVSAYERRMRAEALIDRAIELLDELDGDPDLEGHSTEYDPSTGQTIVLDPDREGDTADDEPTLGAREGVNQTRTWKHTNFAHCLDGETEEDDPPEDDDPGGGDILDEPHDEEPDEPSLGSVHIIDQRGWAQGGVRDLEDGDDNGLGDSGGLEEQLRRHREAGGVL